MSTGLSDEMSEDFNNYHQPRPITRSLNEFTTSGRHLQHRQQFQINRPRSQMSIFRPLLPARSTPAEFHSNDFLPSFEFGVYSDIDNARHRNIPEEHANSNVNQVVPDIELERFQGYADIPDIVEGLSASGGEVTPVQVERTPSDITGIVEGDVYAQVNKVPRTNAQSNETHQVPDSQNASNGFAVNSQVMKKEEMS